MTQVHTVRDVLFKTNSTVSKLMNPKDCLTVKNYVIVLEVLPLLEPLWILVENDTHILSASQNTRKPLLIRDVQEHALFKRRYVFTKQGETGCSLRSYSLVGFEHSGVAVGSFGGEITSLPQLWWRSIRAGITHIYLLLHGLHTLHRWHNFIITGV